MSKLTFYEDEHIYLNDDGVEVPSVTTILNLLSAPDYSKISQSVVEYAARRGSLVHECLELYDYGLPFEEQPIVTPEIAGYLRAYLAFMRDYKPKWELIEQIVYNETLGYCGTLDRAGLIDGQFWIVDLKTNKNPTVTNKITACCQTNAYQHAIGRIATPRAILYLKPDGKYNFVDCNKYEEKYNFHSWGLFTQCLELYQTFNDILNNSRRRKK